MNLYLLSTKTIVWWTNIANLPQAHTTQSSGAPYKTQSSNTDADWIGIDLPQGQEAGHEGAAGGEYMI